MTLIVSASRQAGRLRKLQHGAAIAIADGPDAEGFAPPDRDLSEADDERPGRARLRPADEHVLRGEDHPDAFTGLEVEPAHRERVAMNQPKGLGGRTKGRSSAAGEGRGCEGKREEKKNQLAHAHQVRSACSAVSALPAREGSEWVPERA